jgi:Flp pilus assembly protein TadB
MFSFRSRSRFPGVDIMEAAREREVIRLWNRLRLLEREGRSTAAVLRQIEKVLAERERHAA